MDNYLVMMISGTRSQQHLQALSNIFIGSAIEAGVGFLNILCSGIRNPLYCGNTFLLHFLVAVSIECLFVGWLLKKAQNIHQIFAIYYSHQEKRSSIKLIHPPTTDRLIE